ncbi:MAG: hypothetical protein Q7R30_09965 [Acidobacteriota bacterium]|nr:hypothetical protein [Acidobacteriota bacterium]
MIGRSILELLLFAATASAGCTGVEAPTSATAIATSPVSITYSTSFAPLGGAARLFTASRAGVVSVTLTAAGPPSTVALGLGVGIPRSDGGGCLLSQSVITPAGPAAQLSTAVDAGDYCVKVFDGGTLTELVTVTVALTHP